MTYDTSGYDIAKIRELLTRAFTPETLRRFCMDRPLFLPIVAEFGPSMGLNDMVDRVIGYCRTQLLFPELLAAVQGVNPRQYARFEMCLPIRQTEKPRDKKPPQPIAPALTITSPIYLDLVHVPAGEFRMGSEREEDEQALDDELPQHDVYVSAFYIGKYPVTNEQYQAFVKATGHPMPLYWQ